MKLNITFEHEIPKALAQELGITEESAFEAYFSDGTIFVHLLSEDEERENGMLCPVTAAICEGSCDACAVLDAACTGECLGCLFHGLCGNGREEK